MNKEFPNVVINYLDSVQELEHIAGGLIHKLDVDQELESWNYSLSEADVEAGNRLRIVLQRDWAAVDEWRRDCRVIADRQWFKWFRIFCIPANRVISISSQFVECLDQGVEE